MKNRFRNRPISGGPDLSCYGAETASCTSFPFPAGRALLDSFMDALYVSHYLW